MHYTEAQLKEMATSFLGMYNAKVDVRPPMILHWLAQAFSISEQEALDKIEQLAENGVCD
jgi:hypothetical protein